MKGPASPFILRLPSYWPRHLQKPAFHQKKTGMVFLSPAIFYKQVQIAYSGPQEYLIALPLDKMTSIIFFPTDLHGPD
jgi:hypothetical protein